MSGNAAAHECRCSYGESIHCGLMSANIRAPEWNPDGTPNFGIPASSDNRVMASAEIK